MTIGLIRQWLILENLKLLNNGPSALRLRSGTETPVISATCGLQGSGTKTPEVERSRNRFRIEDDPSTTLRDQIKNNMPKGYMYILKCNDGTYYTGSTKDLERRINEHNAGEGANYTRKRLPVKKMYYEEFMRIDDAFKREKQVQGWSRQKKEALIENQYERLNELSECKNETHYKLNEWETGFGPSAPLRDRILGHWAIQAVRRRNDRLMKPGLLW